MPRTLKLENLLHEILSLCINPFSQVKTVRLALWQAIYYEQVLKTKRKKKKKRRSFHSNTGSVFFLSSN